MAHDCIESLPEFAAIEKAEKPLERIKFLKADPTETEPWRGIMLKNTRGQVPAGAPVFIAQGTADTTVRPEITKRFAVALCRQGTRALRLAPRHEPHLRRQEERRPGTRVDERPRRAGAVGLRTLAWPRSLRRHSLPTRREGVARRYG
jgi:hypothetical protein